MEPNPVAASKALYDELVADVQREESIARQKKPPSEPSGCSLVVVVTPGGSNDRCGGSCGFWDGLLGRSCQMVGSTTPEGLETSCICTGGWFDRIFR
jgi:hypothetical protein